MTLPFRAVWLVELAAASGEEAVGAAVAGALGIPAQPAGPCWRSWPTLWGRRTS
jgi:hypothetical protein